MSAKEITTSKVTDVTLFLQGAEITRTVALDLPEGKSTLVFLGLSKEIVENSLVTSTTGEVRLLATAYKLNYLQVPEKSEMQEKQKLELDALRDELAKGESQKALLEKELVFLSENTTIGGKHGILLEQLKGVGDYYRQRLEDIAEKTFVLEKETKELAHKEQQLSMEIESYQAQLYDPTGTIFMELESSVEQTIEIYLTYFLPTAGWVPSYEIRGNSEDDIISLLLKGKIHQNSGEDWKDIQLTLSSGNPTLTGAQPKLQPWYLDEARPAVISQRQSFASESLDIAYDEMEELRSAPAAKKKTAVSSPLALQQSQQTSMEFTLSVPVSIENLATEKMLDLVKHILPSEYQYYSVRRLEKDVFLLAILKDWEQLSLLPGEVSIFSGNSFVGNTFLDPRQIGDTFEISLGRDKRVVVTRTKGKDFLGKTLLGGNQKAKREWELTVRNTKASPITIKLLDQVPVSVNKSIVVDVSELSGAEFNKETGELSWIVSLDAGETIKRQFRYEVTYPKNIVLTLE